MQSRKKFLLMITACCVAMCFVVASVLADELLGVLTKVDVEGKKITVVDKETEKEIEIKITDETEQVSKKATGKVDLEKLETKVKKAQDAGKKVNIKVTHEKNVASKLEFPRGKGAKRRTIDLADRTVQSGLNPDSLESEFRSRQSATAEWLWSPAGLGSPIRNGLLPFCHHGDFELTIDCFTSTRPPRHELRARST